MGEGSVSLGRTVPSKRKSEHLKGEQKEIKNERKMKVIFKKRWNFLLLQLQKEETLREKMGKQKFVS